MRGLIVYESRYGTTEDIVRRIREELKGVETLPCSKLSMQNIEKAEFLIIGSPIYFERLSKGIERLLKDTSFQEKIKDKPLAIFTVSFGRHKRYLSLLKRFLKRENILIEYQFRGKVWIFDRRKEEEIYEFVEKVRRFYGDR